MGEDIFISVPSEKRIEFNEKNGALLECIDFPSAGTAEV